jgi:hypothetical protein
MARLSPAPEGASRRVGACEAIEYAFGAVLPESGSGVEDMHVDLTIQRPARGSATSPRADGSRNRGGADETGA